MILTCNFVFTKTSFPLDKKNNGIWTFVPNNLMSNGYNSGGFL